MSIEITSTGCQVAATETSAITGEQSSYVKSLEVNVPSSQLTLSGADIERIAKQVEQNIARRMRMQTGIRKQ